MGEHYLGIDVGYSNDEATTGLCLITVNGNSLQWRCLKSFKDSKKRSEDLRWLIPKGARIAGVAIDGPLAPNLELINHYRSAEALLITGEFGKRGKPGQANSGNGQQLHYHATQLANLVVALHEIQHFSLASATHPDAIHKFRLVEAFPTGFLAVLPEHDDCIPYGRHKSDRYWEAPRVLNNLRQLLNFLLPNCRPPGELANITDHEHRAAFICALTALCLERNQYVSVGDAEDGEIILPPIEVWGHNDSGDRWAELALRENLPKVRGNRRFPCHKTARVMRNGQRWIG
ncbi:MAG: hypothetical protein OXN15_03630 [Chloroflexota bacterium]|nr:hypothetical protein [Chloroflexota bacterium]